MKKHAKALLIVLAVFLAIFAAINIVAQRRVYILIENRTDDDIYGAYFSFDFNTEYDPEIKNRHSGVMSGRKHTGEVGDNRLVPFHVGDTISFPIPPSYYPNVLPEEIPVSVGIEMNSTSEYDESYAAGGSIQVPVKRGKCSVIVVTGSADEGFEAAYDRMGSGALSVYLHNGIGVW